MPFPSLPSSPECRLSSRTAKGLGASLGAIKGSDAAAWQHDHNNSNNININGSNSVVVGGMSKGGSQQQQRSPPTVKPLSDSLLRLQSINNNPMRSSPNNNANTISYYPVSPREYCSPEAVRMTMLESSQLSQSQRLKESLYGGVRSVVGHSTNRTTASASGNTAVLSPSSLVGGGTSSSPTSPSSPPPSSPLLAITSATDAKIRPLFNSSGDSVRRALLAINKEASSKRRQGRRVPPPLLPPPPQHQHNDTNTTSGDGGGGVRGSSPSLSHASNNNNEIGSFGRVNGVYVPHPHSVILPWWVPKVTISDAVRCAQSTLGRDLTLHEVNYMRQRRGEDPLDESSAKILLSGGGGGGLGLGSQKINPLSSPSSRTKSKNNNNQTITKKTSSLSPSPPSSLSSSSSPRDRNVLRYNIHAQGPAYPPQVLYRSGGGGGGGCTSSSPRQAPNNNNNNNIEHPVHDGHHGEVGDDDEEGVVVVTTIPNAYSTTTTTTPQQQPPFHQAANTSPNPSQPTAPSGTIRRRRSDLVIDCRLKAQFDDVTGAMRMLSQ